MLCLLKLAGVVAVEITGGPEIPFHPGRPVGEFFHICSLHIYLLLLQFLLTSLITKMFNHFESFCFSRPVNL